MNYLLAQSTAQDFLKSHIGGSKVLRESIDELWTNYIGTGLIWGKIVQLSSIIAFICFCILIISIVKKITSNGSLEEEIDRFILVVIIGILLSGNAAVTADLAKGMRGLAIAIDDTVAAQLKSANTINQEFEELLGRTAANSVLAAAEEQCKGTIDESIDFYEACMKSQLNKYIEESKSPGFTGAVEGILERAKQVTRKGQKFIGYTGTSILFAQDRLKLYINSIVFAVAADMAMLITGLFGPMAVGASLLPAGPKAVFGWIVGYYTIASGKISYTLMFGLLADILNNVDSLTDLVLPVMIGKALPIMATLLAVGGGAVLYSSLASFGLSALKGMSLSKTALKLMKK